MPKKSPILFAGSAEAFSSASNPTPAGSEEGNWVDILQQAFQQLSEDPKYKGRFGDFHKGASLAQAWRTWSALMGYDSICLAALGRPESDADEVKLIHWFSPAQLVQLLQQFLTGADQSIQTMYYDGRSGHCINLETYDEQLEVFVYFDVWKTDETLLDKRLNAAGVDAKPYKDQYRRWCITNAELEKVIYAVFLLPSEWADINGIEHQLRYEQLVESDFFKAFFLREIERGKKEDGGWKLTIQGGGFQEFHLLEMSIDEEGQIMEASLYLDYEWILGAEVGVDPFATNIAERFIFFLAAPGNQDSVVKIRNGLLQLRDPAFRKMVRVHQQDDRCDARPRIFFLSWCARPPG